MEKIIFSDITTPNGYPCDIMVSAVQKFVRRGETEKAVQAAYELYLQGEEMTEYLWKRLMVISVEDVGMGNPMAAVVVNNLYEMSKHLNYPSGDYAMMFVQAIRYMCSSDKERGTCNLNSVMQRRINRGDKLEIPEYVVDMHTQQGREMGRDYLYFLDVASQVNPEVNPDGNTWKEELREMIEAEQK